MGCVGLREWMGGPLSPGRTQPPTVTQPGGIRSHVLRRLFSAAEYIPLNEGFAPAPADSRPSCHLDVPSVPHVRDSIQGTRCPILSKVSVHRPVRRRRRLSHDFHIHHHRAGITAGPHTAYLIHRGPVLTEVTKPGSERETPEETGNHRVCPTSICIRPKYPNPLHRFFGRSQTHAVRVQGCQKVTIPRGRIPSTGF